MSWGSSSSATTMRSSSTTTSRSSSTRRRASASASTSVTSMSGPAAGHVGGGRGHGLGPGAHHADVEGGPVVAVVGGGHDEHQQRQHGDRDAGRGQQRLGAAALADLAPRDQGGDLPRAHARAPRGGATGRRAAAARRAAALRAGRRPPPPPGTARPAWGRRARTARPGPRPGRRRAPPGRRRRRTSSTSTAGAVGPHVAGPPGEAGRPLASTRRRARPARSGGCARPAAAAIEPDGDDAARLDDRDDVADALDQLELVAGEHDGRAPRDLLGQHPRQHVDAHRVEARERLVEHQQARALHERHGQLHPLLVPQRERLHPVARPVGQAQLVEPPGRRLAGRRPGQARQLADVGHLVDGGHAGVEAPLLGHVAEAPGGRRRWVRGPAR